MLVSVAVTTYNSEAFVIEALESVFNQTYSDLELIISDDCSTDNTLSIAIEWLTLDKVKVRFKNIQVLKVQNNTGISANCNRIIKASTSQYIKMIAGDDILYPNCIVDNLNFANENPKVNFIFSAVDVYKDFFLKENFVKRSPAQFPAAFMGLEITAQQQFKLLLGCDRITFTPSYFFKKDPLIKLGAYDEQNKLIEDYPMWLKLTKAGEKLYFFDKVTVGYRAHSKSLSNSNEKTLFQISYKRNFDIKRNYVFQYLPFIDICDEYYSFWINRSFDFLGLNRRKPLNSFAYTALKSYFNPFSVLKKLIRYY